MRTETVIDTIAMQVKFYKRIDYEITLNKIIERLELNNYIIKYDDNIIEIEYKHKIIGTIERGSFSYIHQNNKKANITYYLSIKLAGLKKYIQWRDTLAHNCLCQIVSYLNTNKILFNITQLDIALNMFTKYENTLVLCTNKVKKRKYYKANEEQKYKTTKWIEKFKDEEQKAEASFHGCHYCKTTKEKLDYPLTRFEVSFQKNFFKKKGFNIGSIISEFNRYHIIYMPNKKKKQEIKNKYDIMEVIRQKDRNNLRIELYRLHINIDVLIEFIIKMYSLDDNSLKYSLK